MADAAAHLIEHVTGIIVVAAVLIVGLIYA